MSAKLPEIVAAVDLGSNSFHMIVCSLKDGKLQTLDRLKEMVRLASGLDEKNHLNKETRDRALACLEKFGERISNFPPGSVRIVGTNTLRTAKNARPFLLKAEAALGHPIHVISGIEEARLIYQGVAHSLESNAKRRLVMDIGGGSTEYIIGTNDQPGSKESLNMGCVTVSNAFFPEGNISKTKFFQAVIFAERKVEPIEINYRKKHWDEAIGASGSLRSVGKILQASGWSNNGITREGLEKLVKYIIQHQHINELDLPELDPERKPVFLGGVAIVYATFLRLRIDQMTVSDGALREGLIYDLLGRIYNNDIRSESVNTLANYYHIDQRHANRIKDTIHSFLEQLDIFDSIGNKTVLQFLDWAALLHEIGLAIAHNQYHKHSAYILENADLSGFSRQDQILLSTIIHSHRKKFSKKRFNSLPSPWKKHAPYLSIILRVAVVLHRNRHSDDLPDIKITVSQNRITLNFPEKWLDSSPLTHADLTHEANYMGSAGYTLLFS